jgi:hypothetical protein
VTRVVPSQVVETIDELFPRHTHHTYTIHTAGKISCVVKLIGEIPPELLRLPSDQYAQFRLHLSRLEFQLRSWLNRGGSDVDILTHGDAVASLREVLARCPDEYPAPATADLLFIPDQDLRGNIRADIGTANRALLNAEWKAATVLAGSAIEALLHWKLGEPPLTTAQINAAIVSAMSNGKLKKKPHQNRDYWDLQTFIEVAAELSFITSETVTAANLARDYRNLIHPGKAARQSQVCDRATALSALAGLEHVIRDLT